MPRIAFVDSHVHLDLLLAGHHDRLHWFKKHRCLPVSWTFAPRVRTVIDIETALQSHAEIIRGLDGGGLICFYLAGVHPRSIPDDLPPERVAGLLRPYLRDPMCAGIGEIGLETGTPREEAILRAQLEMAEEVVAEDKVFGVHTPRTDKPRVTERVLSILEDFTPWRQHILVDHCNPETLEEVLGRGWWAGITLSPGKTSPGELSAMLARHPDHQDRILLNTDSGIAFHEDLYRFHQGRDQPESVRLKLTRQNALTFYRKLA